MEDSESCYGPGSVAGAVIGTFLATCILIAVTAFIYRQWRRHKGKHLVLVTDPEIVEEAYAFDNPCFKDATPATTVMRGGLDRPSSLAVHSETTGAVAPGSAGKDAWRWTTPWSNLGKAEKRRTLDDSCLGPKASQVSVVGLRSRDFTGLGFNVCGNMREGIFVKDLLHRGPASESGRIHPGDRISSVKISFRSMVYEDALTILSYASPYDVELEVESGGSISFKPSTLLKKSVSPSPAHICHPLYRSQSIPELGHGHQQNAGQRKNTVGAAVASAAAARRLFVADPIGNDTSCYSNYSTMNSTLKSTKSQQQPSSGQSPLEKRREDAGAKVTGNQQQQQQQQQPHQQPKFGIKVLPALDGTVHRVENQNEHNTNLERRHSRKLESAEQQQQQHKQPQQQQRHSVPVALNGAPYVALAEEKLAKSFNDKRISEDLRGAASPIAVGGSEKRLVRVLDGAGFEGGALGPEDQIDNKEDMEKVVIPSEVPTEVHNAAMAARRNRKSSGAELILPEQKIQQQKPAAEAEPSQESADCQDGKSPQKGKRKAPAPPSIVSLNEATSDDKTTSENEKTTIDGIADYEDHDRTITDSIADDAVAKEEMEDKLKDAPTMEPKMLQERSKRMTSNQRISESDTDSELPNSFTTIELNSADITVHHTPVPESKPNDDVDEEADDVYRKAASLGDLSKYENKVAGTTLERAQSLDMTDTSSKKRKAPMPPPEDINESTEDLTKLDQIGTFDCLKLKKSNKWGTLEDAVWSGSEPEAHEINKASSARKKSDVGVNGGTLERSKSNVERKTSKDESTSSEPHNVSDGALETSLELYNLPLSKQLTQDFIKAERLFDPEEDNALARIVNDGAVLKLPTAKELDLEFRKAHPLPEDDEDDIDELTRQSDSEKTPEVADSFKKAIMYFDMHAKSSPSSQHETKVSLPDPPEELYAGKKEVTEKPMSKVKLNFYCPACEHRHGHHSENCSNRPNPTTDDGEISYHRTIRVEDSQHRRNEPRRAQEPANSGDFETHFAKPIHNIPDAAVLKIINAHPDDDEDEKVYEFETAAVTINSKNPLSASPIAHNKHNVSSVSVSSGENSEDSGLVHESMEFGAGGDPSHEASPRPKMTYVTEIKVSPSSHDDDDDPGHVDDGEDDDDENAASDNEEIVSIMQNSTGGASATRDAAPTVSVVTANGKLPAGKKPPVPPRRSDAVTAAAAAATRFVSKNGTTPEGRQVVYVSEYKSSPTSAKEPEVVSGKKFEEWVYFDDNKWQG